MSYVLFLDESGDHQLKTINKNFPVFCLAGCVFEREYYKAIVRPRLDEFKMNIWGRTDVILHSREIRKQEGDFAFLVNEEKRAEFYGRVNRLMDELEFTLLAVVVFKLDHFNHYGDNARHPYHLAMEFIIERFSLFMEAKGKVETGYIMAESRGKTEDVLAKDEYFRLKRNGTRYRQLDNITGFWMEKKEANIAGLQIADLAAYPIAAKVLRPQSEQKSFDVLVGKFHTHPQNPKTFLGYGLKIFPQPTFEHYLLFGADK